MKKQVPDTFDFRLMRRGLLPRTLTRLIMPFETKECLGKLASSVFTEASNAGQTFQEALLAVYMTGLENGSSAAIGGKND